MPFPIETLLCYSRGRAQKRVAVQSWLASPAGDPSQVCDLPCLQRLQLDFRHCKDVSGALRREFTVPGDFAAAAEARKSQSLF